MSKGRYTAVSRNSEGLSLIELMVAITLSCFLLLGLIQVFAASRTSYQLSQGVARVQENGRFALDFLMRDLRMVGHTGCVNDQALSIAGGGGINPHFDQTRFPLRFDVGVQGYEASGTAPGDDLSLPADPVEGVSGDWSPALPAELSVLKPIKNSDVLMLRFLGPSGTDLQSFAWGGTTTATPVTAGADVTTEFKDSRSLFGLSNCQQISLFQASAIAADGTVAIDGAAGLNTSGLSGVENYSGGGAVMYPAVSVAYYVALNAQGNPALHRTRWEAAPGVDALTAQTDELVEGVESVQLLFGEDRAPLPATLPTTAVPTGYIDKVNTAAVMGTPVVNPVDALRWRRVGAIQLGVLARSSQPSANPDRPVQNVLGVGITPPADARFRSSYETTIALRNRMFGN